MRFLRRGSSSEGEAQVPEWAACMKPAEFGRFMGLVRDWMRGNVREFQEVDGGGIDAVLPNGEKMQLGLTNLAQVCAQANARDWPNIIRGHFGSLVAAQGEMDLSFEHARSMIKVRLYPEDYGQPTDGDPRKLPVTDVIAPGIRRLLALDLPTTVRGISHEKVEAWGKTPAELFDLGLTNIREQDKPEVSEVGEGITLLVGESFFISSYALMLERYLDPVPEHGALVIVATRHTVVFRPIRDVSIATTVGQLIQLAAAHYRQGPGSLSPNLYWWRPSGLTLLPSQIAKGAVQFMPPDDFVAVLNSLPAAGN